MNKPSDRPTPESAAGRVAAWFRTRLDLEPLWAMLRRKPVPIHRHAWIYTLGDTAVFLFALQAASGCLLMLYYQPAQDAAHESVRRIMTEVPFGWLIRSIHAWGASLFLGVVGLHLVTVLFARAYRRPRELTWISGVLMLSVALGSGFSGYLLPWSELSYCATRVGTEIPGKLPGVGPLIVRVLRGSDQLTGETITRFFAAHVAIAPACMILLLSVHALFTRVRGLSLPAGMSQRQVKDRRPFSSEFLLIEVCVWLVLLGAVVTLAVLWPAPVGVKADPLKPAPEGIKPEWYFLFAFQLLKLVPDVVGVALLALGAVFLLVLPFLDGNPQRRVTDRAWTVVLVFLLASVLVLELVALASPGAKHPSEPLAAETYRWYDGLVSLGLLWVAIGFVVYYLYQLVKENARVRRLYSGDRADRG